MDPDRNPSPEPSPEPRASPQYSPDGRWWWTGDQWIPVARPQPVLARLIVVGLIVLIGLLYMFGQSDQEADREIDHIMCERWDTC